MESETEDMRESRCYASIDFSSSFWQAPMHEAFKHLHAFITDRAVYMPTLTLQGGRNSAQNFEGKVVPCFSELNHCLKAWIDDFALHKPTEAELFAALWCFFSICRDRNLKISAQNWTYSPPSSSGVP